MCGRYAIAPRTVDAWATMGDLLGPEVEAMLAALEPQFNVAPTTQVSIVIEDRATGKPKAVLARWGFIPYWWTDVAPPKAATFNARSEEAARKPMWRDAWTDSRCLIAATHWYEWRQDPAGKQPFALQPDGQAFMFAGLYSRWKPPGSDEWIYTAAILTRDAAPSVAHIHDRMPVILHPSAWNGWLDRMRRDRRAIDDILTVNTIMEARGYRISARVNSARNTDSALLDPIDDDHAAPGELPLR